MIWTTSFVLFLCSAIVDRARAKDIPGANWCGDLMCVTALINGTDTITYQMTALNQLGWMAMGFGTQMADAKMVLMWPNIDQSITLSQRTATGLVEPNPDPNPPRNATLYQPLTTLSSGNPTLSFTIPKDNTVIQDIIWAYSFDNPGTSDPNSMSLLVHVDSGNFTLNLSGTVDTDSLPSSSEVQTPLSPPSTSAGTSTGASPAPTSGSGGTGDEDDGRKQPFQTFEKLIIAHAVMATVGFLILLPLGGIIARWGRTFTEKWFYYHWKIQVIFSIPIVVIGWALGPLAVAEEGVKHANDAHKICGILLLPLYIIQLCLGTYIHFRKAPYPIKHPPQNFVHAGLGVLLIGLAFFQVRTGIVVEWTAVTSRPIDLTIFSNLWIAWVIFIPVVYGLGFVLIPRQIRHERELPPPYSPRDNESDRSSPVGVRRLLGLEPVDDGTHDIFSETTNTSRAPASSTAGTTSTDIEMREVTVERWTPISVGSAVGSTVGSTVSR